MNGAAVEQIDGNGAKICVVWTHYDGYAKLRRLKRIVARPIQAAANEGYSGQRINRSQLADGVEQDDFAGSERTWRRGPPFGAPGPRQPAFFQQCNTAPNRSGWRGASTMASCG